MEWLVKIIVAGAFLYLICKFLFGKNKKECCKTGCALPDQKEKTK